MGGQRLSLAQFALAWLVALLAMGALDGVWLGWLAKAFYKREIGTLMADSVRLAPALLFYLLYPVGIVYFGVNGSSTWVDAMIRSAAVGLLAYATYDLSNLATLRGWSVALSAVDTAWGTFASAVAGAAAFAFVIGRTA